MVFAERIGVQAAISIKIIDELMRAVRPAMEMIDRSFLSREGKEMYKEIIVERLKRFKLK